MDSIKCICDPINSGKKKKCPKCHPRCICDTKDSGDDQTCRKCHPHTWMKHTKQHDRKSPAEIKQHNAIPMGQLPWLQVPVSSEEEDPYEIFDVETADV